MNGYQWTGYPTLTYEVPIDGYDGRISLQTLMRRVARGCLHFVQVSFPLISYSRSSPLRRRHSPAVFRSTLIALSFILSKRLPRVPGSQSSPSSDQIDASTRLVKMPDLLEGGMWTFLYITASIPGLLEVVPLFITPFCLSVTLHLYHHHYTKYTTKHNLYDSFR